MRICVLTGAGVSAESGLATFRDGDGLWERHRIEDVATPEAFARDAGLVHRFYDQRRAKAALAQPNAAHRALADLGRRHDLTLVTQNVDDLHERAGSPDVIHMHGQLHGALCADCGGRWRAGETLSGAACPVCGQIAARPDIVWFGEIPYHMEEIADALENCDVFAAIGTSGQVYPAAGFVQTARAAGALTVEMNLKPSTVSSAFAQHRFGPASEIVPEWAESL